MIISEISKKGRNAIIIFDDSYELIIPYEYYVKYPVFKEDDYSYKEREILEKEIELFNIKQSAFRFLSGRNHSKFELKTKLKKKNYDDSLIQITLNDLKERGYLNDREFAVNYFRSQLKKKKGLLKIKADLVKKGVNREIIENISNNYINDPILLKSAIYICEKKIKFLRVKNLQSNQMKQKLYQFLSSRGFSFEIINETILSLNIDKNHE